MSGCVMTVLDIEQQDALWHGGGEKLHGRVAFVTGGIRGIGAAICKAGETSTRQWPPVTVITSTAPTRSPMSTRNCWAWPRRPRFS